VIEQCGCRVAAALGGVAMASFAVSNGLVRSSSSGRMTVFDIDAEVPDSVVLSTEVLRDRARSRMVATMDRDRAQAIQVCCCQGPSEWVGWRLDSREGWR
jgi:hypothetical protein